MLKCTWQQKYLHYLLNLSYQGATQESRTRIYDALSCQIWSATNVKSQAHLTSRSGLRPGCSHHLVLWFDQNSQHYRQQARWRVDSSLCSVSACVSYHASSSGTGLRWTSIKSSKSEAILETQLELDLLRASRGLTRIPRSTSTNFV